MLLNRRFLADFWQRNIITCGMLSTIRKNKWSHVIMALMFEVIIREWWSLTGRNRVNVIEVQIHWLCKSYPLPVVRWFLLLLIVKYTLTSRFWNGAFPLHDLVTNDCRCILQGNALYFLKLLVGEVKDVSMVNSFLPCISKICHLANLWKNWTLQLNIVPLCSYLTTK